MRRGIGFTLICIGLFLAVLGGAIRYWAFDRLVVVPIDLYSTIDLPGRATYLDTTTPEEKTGNVVARQTIRADVDASTDRVLVVDLSQVISTAEGQFIRASVEHAAIDRRTGSAVNCCDESVDEKPARHEGHLFKLPFDAPRGDVLLWDSTTASANPGRYDGTDTIAGHLVHRYISAVPGRQIRTQADSGALVGEARTYDTPVWNTNIRTILVEPVTGIPLAVQLETQTTLRNSRGQDQATVFAATLRSDPAKPSPETLELVEDGQRRIEIVRQMPLLGLGSGAVLAGLGVALLLWRRRAAAPARPPAPVSPPLAPGPATRGTAEDHRRGPYVTGEFPVPAGLSTPERHAPAARPLRPPPVGPPPLGRAPRPGPEPRAEVAMPPQARTWDVADVGAGQPAPPAPVADRPLSRYIRPYLDGDRGTAHQRPPDPSERTESHRAPDPGTARRLDPLDPEYDWLTLIGPETDHTLAPPEPREPGEPQAAPRRRPRRMRRYPDGW